MKINHIKLDLYRTKLNKIYNDMEMKKNFDSRFIIEDKTVEFNGESKTLFKVIVENATGNFAGVESYDLTEKDKVTIANIMAALVAIAALDFTSRFRELDGTPIEDCITQTNEFVRDMMVYILEDCTGIGALKTMVKSELNSVSHFGL